jgi:response regulator RpfG family c-di-GMP phosphodiesterase
LVVEDDYQLRSTTQKILEKLHATVRTAENGLIAKTILQQSVVGFDLILSDIRMPEMDGIELLSYCKKSHSETKFILFTGFSEYLETHTASELGADGFLIKPFRLIELLNTIEQVLFKSTKVLQKDKIDLPEENFCCVAIDDFFSSTRIPSDIYIRVNKEKFIKIAKEHDEIEIGRLKQFREQKVDYLFVRNEDFHKYTAMNLKIASAISKSDKFSDEKKKQLFKHTGEMLLQQIFVSEIDKNLCDSAQSMLNNTVKLIGENEDLFDLLSSLREGGDKPYSHSLAVSVYACMIGTKIGWSSTSSQNKIALSALFHDIGFKELPNGLHDKPRFKMSVADLELYKTHPVRGKDILLSLPGFPAELAMIIGQHHECPTESGYPDQLASAKIHPIAKLLKVADGLVERMSAQDSVNHEMIQIILGEIFETQRMEYDGAILAGAFDLFKVPRPSVFKNLAS